MTGTALTTRFWLSLAAISVTMLGVALYYQYGLDYPPCVVCIHVRLGMIGFIVIAIAGLILSRSRRAQFPLLGMALLLAALMLQRAWVLLGTERGWLLGGECGMDLGLPGGIAPDRWWPALFEVQVPCGYTPVLPFGVTMAEALLAFFILLSVALIGVALALWRHRTHTGSA